MKGGCLMWEEPLVPNSAVCMEYQGGNFHLKVGGPKAVTMLVTLCWGLQ